MDGNTEFLKELTKADISEDAFSILLSFVGQKTTAYLHVLLHLVKVDSITMEVLKSLQELDDNSSSLSKLVHEIVEARADDKLSANECQMLVDASQIADPSKIRSLSRTLQVAMRGAANGEALRRLLPLPASQLSPAPGGHILDIVQQQSNSTGDKSFGETRPPHVRHSSTVTNGGAPAEPSRQSRLSSSSEESDSTPLAQFRRRQLDFAPPASGRDGGKDMDQPSPTQISSPSRITERHARAESPQQCKPSLSPAIHHSSPPIQASRTLETAQREGSGNECKTVDETRTAQYQRSEANPGSASSPRPPKQHRLSSPSVRLELSPPTQASRAPDSAQQDAGRKQFLNGDETSSSQGRDPKSVEGGKALALPEKQQTLSLPDSRSVKSPPQGPSSPLAPQSNPESRSPTLLDDQADGQRKPHETRASEPEHNKRSSALFPLNTAISSGSDDMHHAHNALLTPRSTRTESPHDVRSVNSCGTSTVFPASSDGKGDSGMQESVQPASSASGSLESGFELESELEAALKRRGILGKVDKRVMSVFLAHPRWTIVLSGSRGKLSDLTVRILLMNAALARKRLHRSRPLATAAGERQSGQGDSDEPLIRGPLVLVITHSKSSGEQESRSIRRFLSEEQIPLQLQDYYDPADMPLHVRTADIVVTQAKCDLNMTSRRALNLQDVQLAVWAGASTLLSTSRENSDVGAVNKVLGMLREKSTPDRHLLLTKCSALDADIAGKVVSDVCPKDSVERTLVEMSFTEPVRRETKMKSKRGGAAGTPKENEKKSGSRSLKRAPSPSSHTPTNAVKKTRTFDGPKATSTGALSSQTTNRTQRSDSSRPPKSTAPSSGAPNAAPPVLQFVVKIDLKNLESQTLEGNSSASAFAEFIHMRQASLQSNGARSKDPSAVPAALKDATPETSVAVPAFGLLPPTGVPNVAQKSPQVANRSARSTETPGKVTASKVDPKTAQSSSRSGVNTASGASTKVFAPRSPANQQSSLARSEVTHETSAMPMLDNILVTPSSSRNAKVIKAAKTGPASRSASTPSGPSAAADTPQRSVDAGEKVAASASTAKSKPASDSASSSAPTTTARKPLPQASSSKPRPKPTGNLIATPSATSTTSGQLLNLSAGYHTLDTVGDIDLICAKQAMSTYCRPNRTLIGVCHLEHCPGGCDKVHDPPCPRWVGHELTCRNDEKCYYESSHDKRWKKIHNKDVEHLAELKKME